jgi:2-iminoacetate synthase
MQAQPDRTASSAGLPSFLDPIAALDAARNATKADVARALAISHPDERTLAVLLSTAADEVLDSLARRAQALTRRHFGRTISLYAPLYLSNYCGGGCVYCGFAADRKQPRRRLDEAETLQEILAMKAMGLEDVLLLTGERCPEADLDYLLQNVRLASRHFHNVTVESFAMTTDEYRALAEAGCTGVTLYQETYDPGTYHRLHRWGPKRDYPYRLEAADRALSAGMRTFGIGALLGLADPLHEAISLYLHARYLCRKYWRSGILVSFPRLCAEPGRFMPEHEVGDRFLARVIYAFRICLPEVPLVLSTREAPRFRDGMAGVGISRMSVASRTTVGGYSDGAVETGVQFDINDGRDARTFCAALRLKGLEPVFKNWDAIFQGGTPA